ncbi:MAG: kelch repeat-containing protein, partial [Pseudomonadota bacterium]
GGRRTNTPIPFANTVGRTNVYDFNAGSWSNAADIPTERAGTMTVAIGDEVIVIGGESTASNNAHRQVEAFNVNTRRWRSLDQLNTARHGGATGVLNGKVHVVAGNITRGGGRETSAHEVLR